MMKGTKEPLPGGRLKMIPHFSLGMLELVIGGRRVGRNLVNLNFFLDNRNPSFGETAIRKKMTESTQRFCG